MASIKPKHNDVAELCGPERDPADPEGHHFHFHIKSARNTRKPGTGFRVEMDDDGHHVIIPAARVIQPRPEVIEPVPTPELQVLLRLEDYVAESEDVPDDMKSEIDRLTPRKVYRFGGSTMIHAPGMIRFAQNLYRSRSRKDKATAMAIVKSWPGPSAEDYVAILSGGCHIDADGDTAVITLKDY